MKCKCGQKLLVHESRPNGLTVARLRYCPNCDKTFETRERAVKQWKGKRFYLARPEKGDPRIDYHKAP